jgi:hypothetical protein
LTLLPALFSDMFIFWAFFADAMALSNELPDAPSQGVGFYSPTARRAKAASQRTSGAANSRERR